MWYSVQVWEHTYQAKLECPVTLIRWSISSITQADHWILKKFIMDQQLVCPGYNVWLDVSLIIFELFTNNFWIVYGIVTEFITWPRWVSLLVEWLFIYVFRICIRFSTSSHLSAMSRIVRKTKRLPLSNFHGKSKSCILITWVLTNTHICHYTYDAMLEFCLQC